MIFLLSPAKSLNYDIETKNINSTTPEFLSESKILVDELKKFSPKKISELMSISDKLASLNYQRYQEFRTPFTDKNSKPALFVFDGDVYDGIDVENYNKKDLEFAQNHLRILSGLYGVLRPLDLMQAYRLEMSTVLKNKRGKNLYEFWQEKITENLNEMLAKSSDKIILNLASEEYFKAVNTKKIKGKIIDIVFKEKKKSDYKIVGIFAKKARGLMANYIIKNKITDISEIKKFNIDGYRYKKEFSSDSEICFVR